jgi:hypothetical protein
MIDPMNTSNIQKRIIITSNTKHKSSSTICLDAEKTQEKSGKRKIREMEMVVSRMPRFARETNR